MLTLSAPESANVRDIVRVHLGARPVKVFGSRACGTAKPFSDPATRPLIAPARRGGGDGGHGVPGTGAEPFVRVQVGPQQVPTV